MRESIEESLLTLSGEIEELENALAEAHDELRRKETTIRGLETARTNQMRSNRELIGKLEIAEAKIRRLQIPDEPERTCPNVGGCKSCPNPLWCTLCRVRTGITNLIDEQNWLRDHGHAGVYKAMFVDHSTPMEEFDGDR